MFCSSIGCNWAYRLCAIITARVGGASAEHFPQAQHTSAADGTDDVFLAAEVVINSALGIADFTGHPFHGQTGKAFPVEDVLGGIQYQLFTLLALVLFSIGYKHLGRI